MRYVASSSQADCSEFEGVSQLSMQEVFLLCLWLEGKGLEYFKFTSPSEGLYLYMVWVLNSGFRTSFKSLVNFSFVIVYTAMYNTSKARAILPAFLSFDMNLVEPMRCMSVDILVSSIKMRVRFRNWWKIRSFCSGYCMRY